MVRQRSAFTLHARLHICARISSMEPLRSREATSMALPECLTRYTRFSASPLA